MLLVQDDIDEEDDDDNDDDEDDYAHGGHCLLISWVAAAPTRPSNTLPGAANTTASLPRDHHDDDNAVDSDDHYDDYDDPKSPLGDDDEVPYISHTTKTAPQLHSKM